jgi:predicted CXXCH cytochrome family protein
MRSHVLRPLWVVVGLVVIVLIIRAFYVPSDFGVGQRGYMYGWHRAGDAGFWKNFPVSYKFQNDYCSSCHPENYNSIMKSPHAIIHCENCHGPVLNHPSDPPKLKVDKRRALCLRCHYPLPYPTSGRANIPGIDPVKHYPDNECVTCHNPHNPLEGLK